MAVTSLLGACLLYHVFTLCYASSTSLSDRPAFTEDPPVAHRLGEANGSSIAELILSGEVKDAAQPVLAVTLVSDGWLLTGSKDAVLRVYKQDPWPPQAPLWASQPRHGAITSIAVSRDGLVAAAHPNVVSLWELGQAPSVAKVLHDVPQVVEFSLDGQTLLVGGTDGQLRFYTPSSTTNKFELRRSVLLGPKPILAVAFGNHSMLIALSAVGVYMYDTHEKMIVQQQEDPFEKLTSLSMAPNRCWFATGAQSGLLTGYLMGLCVSDRVPGFSSRFQWPADEDAGVTALVFAPDSRFLVVATKSRRLRFHPLESGWEAPRTTGFFLQEAPASMVLQFTPLAVSFSGDSCKFAAGSDDLSVRIYTSSDKQCRAAASTTSLQIPSSASVRTTGAPSSPASRTSTWRPVDPPSDTSTLRPPSSHANNSSHAANEEAIGAMIIVLIVGLIMVIVMASGFWMWVSEARQVARPGGAGVEMSHYVPPSV